MTAPTLVLVESPYSAPDAKTIARNLQYARRAMRDCFKRGEYPFASHLLYTQQGILDDTDPEERKLGIQAGLVWGQHAARTVVYADHGISEGMRQGINEAHRVGRPIVVRYLDERKAR